MENLISLFLDGMQIMSFIGVLYFFTRARSTLMEKWGVAVAEDYVGMTMKEYHEKLKQESK